jgi:hypothetical protein
MNVIDCDRNEWIRQKVYKGKKWMNKVIIKCHNDKTKSVQMKRQKVYR